MIETLATVSERELQPCGARTLQNGHGKVVIGSLLAIGRELQPRGERTLQNGHGQVVIDGNRERAAAP